VRRQAESADLHLPQSAVLTPQSAYVQSNTKIKLNKITTKLKLLQKTIATNHPLQYDRL
jgi:hypothetical protein